MKTHRLLISVTLCCILLACNTVENKKPGQQIKVRSAFPDKSLSSIMDSLHLTKKDTWIYVDKSDIILLLKHDSITLKSYPVVLGKNPTADKNQQGDNCTPEGIFHLRDLYPHKGWSKFLWIDYPTAESYKKHEAAKKEGKISANAKIGGEIGIHGVPDGTDYMIDENMNWTAGCISLKNAHINEIYQFVEVGTKVEIVQ